MGYPSNIQLVTRKLTDDIIISSGAFTRVGRINFGSRMALFRVQNSIVVWSAIPYCDEVKKALDLFSETPKVTHLIVPDTEHTIGAQSFKKEFPELKIIAMEGGFADGRITVDYRITAAHANQVLDNTKLKEIGILELEILDNFQFVYLPGTGNKELVTYHKPSRSVFEADLLFNLRSDQPMEQFSVETGFPANYNPFTGWSFLARYLNADSAIGRFLFRRFASVKVSAPGLNAINSWDFLTLVMCHGNVLDKDGKTAFQKVFGLVL